MTPQKASVTQEVGIRELRDRLSRYLRDVADGGEVIVTDRGKRVARISPIDARDPLAELRRRGLVREPTRAKRRASGRRRPRSSAPVSELVAEQRR